jgi:pimeloyl-ACP methyl ester carboxylesterase
MEFQYKTGRIFYNDQGTGAAIVLLHGYLETSAIWDNFARRLSENFRVITIDLPGHGGSDCFGNVHRMEFLAATVKDLLSGIGIDKFFLAGHSMGGYVTLAFVEQYAELLTGYSLIHSQPFPDTPEAKVKRAGEISMVREDKKDQFIPDNITRMYSTSNLEKLRDAVKRSKEIASGISGEGIIAVLSGMMERPSRLSVMEEGRVPCLWILGEADNFIQCNGIQARVRLPANAQVAVLKNSGHMGFIEEEDLTLKILSDFVTLLV